MRNRDNRKLISDLTALCQRFEPTLAAYRQDLLELKRSSESKLEDLWSLRGKVERAQRELRVQLGQTGFNAQSQSKMKVMLERKLVDQLDLLRDVTNLRNGFPGLLEAIESYEEQIVGPYFEALCERLSEKVEELGGDLRQLSSSEDRSSRLDSIEFRVTRLIDEFGLAAARTTHGLWRSTETVRALEKRFERYPGLFGSVNEVFENLSRILGEVLSLQREIRNAQTPSSGAKPSPNRRSQNP
jgi:hypothetical protein